MLNGLAFMASPLLSLRLTAENGGRREAKARSVNSRLTRFTRQVPLRVGLSSSVSPPDYFARRVRAEWARQVPEARYRHDFHEQQPRIHTGGRRVGRVL